MSASRDTAPALPPGLARAALTGVDAYEPGRPVDEVRRETGVASIVKLASNEGPFPPMPAALAAIRASAEGARAYPDPGAWALRDAIAARTGLTADRVLPGAGVDGLIKLLCLALLEPGDEVAMGWPSFLSWRVGAQIQGAAVRAAPLRADGSYDLDALGAQVTPRTKIVVVVSPNNPTGGAVGARELTAFLDALPQHVLPVVDEAYFEFLPPGGHDAAAMVAEGRLLACARTFSKAYGLAGLRVGYALSHPDIADLMNRVRHPFNVNQIAQTAAVAALGDDAHIERAVALNRTESERVGRALREAFHLNVLPTAGNFLCVEVGDAAAVNEGLLRRGVIVRPIAGYGLPRFVRITLGTEAENERLLAALRELRAAGALGSTAA